MGLQETDFVAPSKRCHDFTSNILMNSFSSMIATPSSLAFCCFVPASSPAIRKSVFLLTEPTTLPPWLAATAPTDDQIRQQIVHQSVAEYHGTGHPCACPYDLERNGRMCGRVSAYSRPGGAAPLCYPQDVSDGMVADWRRISVEDWKSSDGKSTKRFSVR